MKLIKIDRQLRYRSSIAILLAAQSRVSAATIAQEISENWSGASITVDDSLFPSSPNIAIVALPSGWLEWPLCDAILAHWLSNGLQVDWECQDISISKVIPVLYHYTYARCSTLLRLAHEQNWIQLSSHASPIEHPWLSPAEIIWQQPSPQGSLGSLRFGSTGHELLHQLIDSADTLGEPLISQHDTTLTRLCHAVERYDRDYRLLAPSMTPSEVSQQTDRAAHLALLWLSARVLRAHLQRLGVSVCPQL